MINLPKEAMVEEPRRFIDSIQLPLIFLGVIWAIHILQWLMEWRLGFLGVYPRYLPGMKGILFSPLIHADFSHLISNSFPLFVLSSIIIYFYPRVAVKSFIMIYLLTGLAVWLLARSVFHIGASGVVYGLLAFIFWNGIFRRNGKAIVLSLIVMVMFQGMFMGVLPNQEGISWESHLLGAIVGIFAAYYFKEEIEADEIEEAPSWARDTDAVRSNHFLPRDTFEKTKAQREQEAREQPPDWTTNNTWD